LFVAPGLVFSVRFVKLQAADMTQKTARLSRNNYGCVYCHRRAPACSKIYCIFEAFQDLACPQRGWQSGTVINMT